MELPRNDRDPVEHRRAHTLREQLLHETHRQLNNTHRQLNNTHLSNKEDKQHCCRKNMPWQHEVLLTPYEKYLYYRVVPVKMFLHICLCLTILYVVINNVEIDNSFTRSSKSKFCNIVTPNADCRHGSDVFPDNIIGQSIYSQSEFLQSMQIAVSGLCKNDAAKGVDILFTGSNLTAPLGVDQQMHMEWSHVENNKLASVARTGTKDFVSFPITVATDNVIIACDNLGPFDKSIPLETLSNNILATKIIKLTGQFANYHYRYEDGQADCVLWKYNIIWDFSSRGLMVLDSHITSSSPCMNDEHHFEPSDILTAVLSIVVFVLSCRSLLRRTQLAFTIRGHSLVNQNSTIQHRKSAISLCGKFRVFLPSHFVNLAGGACLLGVNSIVNLIRGYSRTPTSMILKTTYGFGMIVVFYELKRYLTFGTDDKRTFLLFLVLERAGPRVLYFMMSCIPVVTGFTLAGTVFFGSQNRLFASYSATFSTLFCISNGDSMVNIFEAVYYSDGWLGYAYLYIWSSLVIFVIVNIFLVIVQQTYEDISECQRQEQAAELEAKKMQARAAAQGEVVREEVARGEVAHGEVAHGEVAHGEVATQSAGTKDQTTTRNGDALLSAMHTPIYHHASSMSRERSHQSSPNLLSDYENGRTTRSNSTAIPMLPSLYGNGDQSAQEMSTAYLRVASSEFASFLEYVES